ncbi:MAG: histidine kinase [Pseudomonadota bacterium]
MRDAAETKPSFLIPELCSSGSLLMQLLLGFVLALVLTLGGDGWLHYFWLNFGLTLLFVQWLILISVFVICRCNRFQLFTSPLRVVLLFPVIAVIVTVVSTSVFVWGGFLATVTPGHWLLLRNGVLAGVLGFAFARYAVLQASWRQSVTADASARLDALQARIRPHFLFNALNTVTELVHSRPDQAEEALLDLSDLLRSGLRRASEHSLEDELELIRGYLRIEALRLGPRLQVAWQIDERIDLSQVRPALLIQPLVENAIVHGIAPDPSGGLLKIELKLIRFGRIRVTIENPIPQHARPHHEGNGTALDNIRQRLDLAYEEGAQLKTQTLSHSFRTVLTLPPGKNRG